MLRQIPRRALSHSALFAIGALLVACSGADDSATKPSPSQPAAQQAAKSPAKTPPSTIQETKVAKVSADAQKCLDLVKSKSYAEAVDVCQKAMQDGANTDVQAAYDEAVAAVQEQAKAAAIQAAAESLSGKDPAAAAKDALKGFGKK